MPRSNDRSHGSAEYRATTGRLAALVAGGDAQRINSDFVLQELRVGSNYQFDNDAPPQVYSRGDRTAVLAVLSASEHPTPSFVERLAHESD